MSQPTATPADVAANAAKDRHTLSEVACDLIVIDTCCATCAAGPPLPLAPTWTRPCPASPRRWTPCTPSTPTAPPNRSSHDRADPVGADRHRDQRG